MTQPGFPEGRVGAADRPGARPRRPRQPEVDPDRIEFADPGRFMALADLYTKLIVSDEVREPHPRAAGAGADPGQPAARRLRRADPADHPARHDRARRPRPRTQLNRDVAKALRELLEERQSKNDISPAQRVQITTLNAPSPGVLTAGPVEDGLDPRAAARA